MLILHFGVDPEDIDAFFRIRNLDRDGVTIFPKLDDVQGVRFTWAQSAAMELDIGAFLTGQIDRATLDARQPLAWAGLALSIAAESELMRREQAQHAAPARH